jgi:hypothetical protein
MCYRVIIVSNGRMLRANYLFFVVYLTDHSPPFSAAGENE